MQIALSRRTKRKIKWHYCSGGLCSNYFSRIQLLNRQLKQIINENGFVFSHCNTYFLANDVSHFSIVFNHWKHLNGEKELWVFLLQKWSAAEPLYYPTSSNQQGVYVYVVVEELSTILGRYVPMSNAII